VTAHSLTGAPSTQQKNSPQQRNTSTQNYQPDLQQQHPQEFTSLVHNHQHQQHYAPQQRCQPTMPAKRAAAAPVAVANSGKRRWSEYVDEEDQADDEEECAGGFVTSF
jgi:hypothetical protein